MSEAASVFWFRNRTLLSCIPSFNVTAGSAIDTDIANRILRAGNIARTAHPVGGSILPFVFRGVNIGGVKVVQYGTFANNAPNRDYDDPWLTTWADQVKNDVPELVTIVKSPLLIPELSTPLTDSVGEDLLQKYSHIKKIGGKGNVNPDFKIVAGGKAQHKITALGKGQHSGVRMRTGNLQLLLKPLVGASAFPVGQMAVIQDVELEALANYEADLSLLIGMTDLCHYSVDFDGTVASVKFHDEIANTQETAIAAMTTGSKLRICWHVSFGGSNFNAVRDFNFSIFEIDGAGKYISRYTHPLVSGSPDEPFFFTFERFHLWKNLASGSTTGSHNADFVDERTLLIEASGPAMLEADPVTA